ncbi:MAG: hypothetical protein P4N60_13795 [Verrucomicrobiae bacterium]|nr:hypothetical protein [Verrucomicrobiae bacterium]
MLTAEKTSQFEIGYAAYPMAGIVVVIANVAARSFLTRFILWPHGEQQERK